MKALCWHGKNDVRVDQVPDPKIINSRDAIIKVTSTAICGSDLHLYNGLMPTMESGDILGHEFMGEVVEVGSDIKNLKVGDAKNESPIGGIVNGIATVAAKILQDSKTKTIATKINLSGSINDPDSSILSIIGYLIQHGFIRSLLPQIDHTIGIEDVIYGKPLDSKSKFPRYRN